MNTEITHSPEYEKKLNLRKVYRNLFATLSEEKQNMLTNVEPHLNALYMTKFGKLKYEIFSIESDIAKLKLEMKLIQSYINRNQNINFEKINMQLEEATEVYKQKLEAQAQAIIDAHELLASSHLTEDEALELKKLYRDIAKRLHPDINQNLSDKEKELFARAQFAYNIANLEELRVLHKMIMDSDTSVQLGDDLVVEIEHLQKLIKKLESDIEKLNQRFPFNQRELLQDENRILEEKEKLRKRISELEIERTEYQTYINALKLWKPGLSN